MLQPDEASEVAYEVKYKVITKMKTEEKRVPKVVAQRKKWRKFGDSARDKPGEPNPTTTFLGEDQKIVWIRKSTGEAIMADEENKKAPTTGAGASGHCRLCKQDGHWSTHCPYKGQLMPDSDESGE